MDWKHSLPGGAGGSRVDGGGRRVNNRGWGGSSRRGEKYCGPPTATNCAAECPLIMFCLIIMLPLAAGGGGRRVRLRSRRAWCKVYCCATCMLIAASRKILGLARASPLIMSFLLGFYAAGCAVKEA